MYKRALVTGGAGFIGSHLARALLKEHIEVVVLDNLSMGKIENVPEGAEFICGDVRSKDDTIRALHGVDIVFHEAARVSIRSSVEHFHDDAENNLMGTINLLRCCQADKVKKIIFASSMAVYADCKGPIPIVEDYTTEPISPYGISKLASEKYCMRFSEFTGIDCHVLRYFNTYGTGQTLSPYVGVITIFINRLLDGEPPIIFGDGEQKRDFIHVGDIDLKSKQVKGRSGKWSAEIMVKVHNSQHQELSNVKVSVEWSGASIGTESGITNNDGEVFFETGNIEGTSITLTVVNLEKEYNVYEPKSNHDPEEDSDGTHLTIYQ